jgi:nitrile hydratase accessory protein
LNAHDGPWPAPPELTADGPTFAAPWQAQAFALAVALHESGAFTWPEWTTALGAELARSGRQGPDDYYAAWLAALERLSSDRGLASPPALAERKRAWAEAYLRTPHGRPVVLGDS